MSPRPGATYTYRDLATADAGQLQAMGISRDDATIILNHWDTVLPTDDAFNVSHVTTLPFPATDFPIVGVQTPPGMLGIVRMTALQTVNFALMNLIRWSIRINGNPVQGYDRIRGPFGTYLIPRPISIPLFKNALVEIVATNLGAAPIPLVNGALTGHFFAAGAP